MNDHDLAARPASAGTPMIHLDRVSKSYGGFQALREVSLTVRQGEFVTLLGPSGSGKSTLLNLIAGTSSPDSGSIHLNGKDARHLDVDQRGLGMVFQHYALIPHMTVFDNIAFPLRVRKVPRVEIKRRVEAVMTLVGLDAVGRRRPSELSGGQQQRVSLARCIVYNPPVILMDEPLGALDKQLREQMQLEIKRLHAELGITMVYVTHDQDEALTMSDRIVLMRDGKIEQLGTPEQLYFHPETCFAASFLGHSNLIKGTVSRRDHAMGGMSLDTSCGIFPVQDATGAMAAGAEMTLLVRPENIELLYNDSHGDGRASLQATVDDSVVLGGVIRHFLTLSNGTPLIVQELNRAACIRPRRGEVVRAGWLPSDGLLLRQ
jgi:putative spermidine/putrescine transport system ATP-binding protein